MRPLDTIGLPPRKESVNFTPVLKTIFKIIIGLGFLGLIALAIWLLKDRWQEVKFAISYPDMVKEVRQVYEYEHKEADKRFFLRQRVELGTPTTETVEITETVKKGQ